MLILLFLKKQAIYSSKSIAKTLYLLIVLLLDGSCKQKNSKVKSIQEPSVVAAELDVPIATRNDTILNTVTDYVEGRRFVITCYSGYNLILQNEKGHTIYQDSVYSPKQDFLDFNGDGYKDILIDYMTNTPGIQDFLLYDITNKTYKKVIYFQRFPSAQRIGNTKYYYSYHRSGCADYNWDSDLFYIKNYEAVRIGNISGRECNDASIKDGIYINKLINEEKIEIQKLPIGIIKEYKDYKWGFIAQYWRKNYKKFL
ncbi:hypothetical protein [Emticicia fluvialis]|uniref:hypothetical protein n=1 Tax=Emticicia fluvialis TaxID=2974474 RepID=UPI0021654286|nr:hypothetical protein [Emticicia fluvialis]